MTSSAPRGTLLVFVEDPGAANGVVGLPARLREKGVEALVVVAGAAAEFLQARSEPFQTQDGESATALLERTRPAAVFVGTAENPDTFGLALVAAAKARGVLSIGFVDAASCAEHRWRGRTRDPLAFCPDHVLVGDAETEEVFVQLGLPRARIHRCGHPQFDALVARRADLAKEEPAVLRARVFPDLPKGTERRVVVFCGERSTGGFGDDAFDAQFRRSGDYTLFGRGSSSTRTEIVTEELLDALTALPKRPFTVLRFHPKNIREDFGALADEFDALSVGGTAIDLLYASDLVVGMSSMVMLEATLLERPTLSIVASPGEREWLPALARETTPCVSTRAALRRFLSEWAEAAPGRRTATTYISAMDRVVELVVELTGGAR